ncbi:MAG TPA: hypothetical protein VEM35_02335 [Rhizomicrobium sp.]|nr:hypothetical protein [Rhizomicrobium sp.]
MRAGIPVAALAFLLFAPHAYAAAPCPAAESRKPCPAAGPPAADCHCKAARRLDRPSTPQELAETARLNREYLTTTRPPPAAPTPPLAGQQADAPPAPYGSQLEQYRALREAYDRQLRAYYRAFPPSAYARPPAPLAYAPPRDESYGQDAARQAPWHGYNRHDGPTNGY